MEENLSQASNSSQETCVSFNNVPLLQVIEKESLNLKNSVFKGLVFKEKPVALKKVEYDPTGVRNGKDLEKLFSLKNENIVTYHNIFISDSISRYIVMDLCVGSMLDFLQDKIVRNEKLDMSRAMFETAYGLAYLHEKEIVHGCLTLSKVLIWTENGNPNFNPIVKITGYIQYIDNDKMGVQNDIDSLGNIFYAMATKDTNNPRNDLNTRSLKLLKGSQQLDAFITLINSLLKLETTLHFSTVKDLLVYPFFTINVKSAQNLLNGNELVNVEELQKWYDGLGNTNSCSSIKQHNFEDLKGIISSARRTSDAVAEAFEYYPEIFSRFIWDQTKTNSPEKIVQDQTFIKEIKIGGGANGIVYAGKWVNKEGKEIKAACKALTKKESKEDFDKEVQALKELDHLFVIKFLGVCEIELENCIVMELCDGTLESYVKKGLKRIPKNSLDDKIILGQVTLGLAYIHSKKMIHKDLKPANILLWKQSSDSNLVLAKIADFGFAKKLKNGKNVFSETTHPGTRSCMAPELLRRFDTGEKFEASFASDAYSLGITIAYTVLKGTHPYGKQLRQFLMSSGCDPIHLGELEWDVTDLILKLIKEEPNERPKVGLVIYHPYFSLTNENTKTHFHEKIGVYFERFHQWKTNKYFEKESIKNWVETVKGQISNEKNNKVREELEKRNIKNEQILDVLKKIENLDENYLKITNAISPSQPRQAKQRSFRSKYTLSDLFRKLISTHPQCFTSYIWSLLTNKTDDLSYLKVTERAFGCLYHKVEEYKKISYLNKRVRMFGNDQGIYQLADELPLYAMPEDELIEISKCLKSEDSLEEANESLLWILLNHRWYGKLSLIKAIVQNGTNPNQHCLSLKKRTAIHLAAENESEEGFEILKFLLEQGGNPNVIDEWERTPLHCAAENESSAAFKMVQLLLEQKGNLDVVDDWKRTLLHCATQNESNTAFEMVKLLLKENKDLISAIDDRNQTPVHYAARNKSSAGPKIMKFLLEKDGDPNAIDDWNQTPLHCAARNESNVATQMMKLLLEKKGNPSVIDKRKRTPLYYATHNKSSARVKICKLLRQKETADNNRKRTYNSLMNQSVGSKNLKLSEKKRKCKRRR